MQRISTGAPGQFSGIFEIGIDPIPFAKWYEFSMDKNGEFCEFLKGGALATQTHKTLMQLPFTLGESAAELKVPYSFDDVIEGAISEAMEALLRIIYERAQETISKQERGDSSLHLKNLSERCLGWNTAVRLMLYGEIWNSSSAERWLDARGKGRAVISALRELYMRAAIEDLKEKGKTPFIYATHLAVLNTIDSVKREYLKQVTIKGLSYEKLERVVGVAFWALIIGLNERFLDDCYKKKLPLNYERLVPWLFTTTKPSIFITVARNLDRVFFNPYEMNPEILKKISSYAPKITGSAGEMPPVEEIAENIVRPLINNDDYLAKLLAQYLHVLVVKSIAKKPIPTPRGCIPLEELATSEPDIEAFVANPKDAVRWNAFFREIREDNSWERLDADQQNDLATLLFITDCLAKKRLDLIQERFLTETEPIRSFSFLAYHYINDTLQTKSLKLVLNMLDDRRRTADLSQLNKDYEEGKLYRLGVDELPIIQTSATEKCGQLFIDLKDFTRRTHRAKEVVIADFLEEEFYKPILKAAAKYASETPNINTIQLNNLLGDAALFSGSVTNLVWLARDIQEITRRYEERLNEIAPVASLDYSLNEVNQRYKELETKLRAEEAQLKSEQKSLREKLENKQKIPTEKVMEVLKKNTENRLAQLKNELDQSQNGDEEARKKIIRQANLVKKMYKETLAHIEKLGEAEKRKFLLEKITEREQGMLKQITERLNTIQKEYNELKSSLESERESITGFGLQIGVFVSYGDSPSIITLNEPPWEGFNVAIGEKINEAARGTTRSQPVINRLNAQLELMRKRLGKPHLELPFKAYIEESYELKLPPELQLILEEALKDESSKLIEKFSAAVGEYIRKDIAPSKKSPQDASKVLEFASAIYNEGECLSLEALENFMQENLASYMHIHKLISVSELSEEIKSRFFFHRPIINLIISVDREKPFKQPFIFRFVGRMRFRGFERKEPTTVFELLRPRSSFFRLFNDFHLPTIVEEATANPNLQISTLDGVSF
ncbi:MAG: hypothetical protein Kow0090_01070 [Myxococcota bacterium]